MTIKFWRGGVLAVFCGIALATISIPATPFGIRTAQAQTVEDFQAALEPYGEWRPHPRWGDIWVPFERQRGWRPYTVGHWVYTDEWGWFWVSDDDEEDWGWIAFHYGRWMFERGVGWFWIPGEDWAPAWVDWRYSDDAVGWAPLPPEDAMAEFDEEPGYWVFVSPRYMLAPRWRTYMIPAERRAAVFRATRLVNRTVPLQGRRIAVNPGIAPAHIAAVTRSSVPTFRVSPRVFAATAGVAGAVAVTAAQVRGGRQQQGGPGRPRVNAVSVQQTTTVVQPSNNAAPRALGQGERGHFGPRAPRAAQGTTIQQQPQTLQQPQTQQQPAQSQPVQPQQRQIQQAPAQSQPAPRRELREQRPEVRPSGEQPAIVRPGEPAKPQRPMIDQTPPRQQAPNRQERVQQPGIVRPQTESRPVQQPQQPQQPRVQQPQQPQQPRPVQQQAPQQPKPVQQQAPAKPAQPAAQPAKPAAKPDEKKKPEDKK